MEAPLQAEQNMTGHVDPAHPETWSQAQRGSALKESKELFQKYMSAEYAGAFDAISDFKRVCESKNIHYADAYLAGDLTAEDYRKVDAARKLLNTFWTGVREYYKEGMLMYDGKDFFAPKKRWFRMGNEYRALVEPLDIANWYKCGFHNTASGHYIDTVVDGEDGLRPSRYAFLDGLKEAEGDEHVDSLSKAEEYKRDAESGKLRIQTKADAHATPGKGFLEPEPLDTSRDDVSEKPLSDLGQSPRDHFSNPSPQAGPISAGFEALKIVADSKAGRSSAAPSCTFPRWTNGVPYHTTTGRLRPARRKLPEPKNGGKSLIPTGTTWNEDTQAPEIEIQYHATVYVADTRKFLVVRAKVYANVDLTHDYARHCGYFQESLKFWMQPSSGQVERGRYTFPENVEQEANYVDIKFTDKKVNSKTIGGTANVGALFTAPIASVGLSALRTLNDEGAQERTIKSAFVSLSFRVDNGRLIWEKTIQRMQDGSSFRDRKLNDTNLRSLFSFARTSTDLEVQGTWSFEEDFEDSVTVSFCAGQNLCYDAAIDKGLVKKDYKLASYTDVFRDVPQEVVIATKLPDNPQVNKQGSDLPEWDV